MEKRISFTDFQSVKAVAKAINPIIIKRDKTKEKIAALAEEYKGYDKQIDALSAGITSVLGVAVNDVVVKAVDASGVSKYVPSDKVHYDTVKKEYVITLPDAEEQPAVETEKTTTEEPEAPAVDFNDLEEENPFDI